MLNQSSGSVLCLSDSSGEAADGIVFFVGVCEYGGGDPLCGLDTEGEKHYMSTYYMLLRSAMEMKRNLIEEMLYVASANYKQAVNHFLPSATHQATVMVSFKALSLQ